MAAAASRTTEPNRQGVANPKCGARGRTGKPCALAAGHGTDHPGYGACKFHGGSVRNGRVHAAKERVARLIEPRPISGPEAMQEALDWQTGLVDRLIVEVELLSAKNVVSRGELIALVRLAKDAQRDKALLGKLAADTGIAERRLALDEQLADLVTDAVRAILTDLDVEITDHVADVVQLRVAERQAA